jgi:hypothetical protein
VGAELASGVRKLLRGHETNMRGLFAGREEAAMRQTEGLRVHVESTVEQSEERMSQLVENALPQDQADALGNIGDNVSHLIRLVGSLRTDMAAAAENSIRHRRQSAPTTGSGSTEPPRNSGGDVEGAGRRSFGGRTWTTARDADDHDDSNISLPGGAPHLRHGSYIPPTPARPGFAGGAGEDDEEGEAAGERATVNSEGAAPAPPPTTATTTDGEAGQENEGVTAEYIRVPDGNGGHFFFDTKSQELWAGPGTPPADQIVTVPSIDSPVVPPRDEA